MHRVCQFDVGNTRAETAVTGLSAAVCGSKDRSTLRQSIPSNDIDDWALVRLTVRDSEVRVLQPPFTDVSELQIGMRRYIHYYDYELGGLSPL